MRRLEGATRQRGKRSAQATKSSDLLQGLHVDLRGQDQNRNERDPNKHKEADHELLGAIEVR